MKELTKTEREVWEQVSMGYTDQAIASLRFVSVNTVKSQLSRIGIKLKDSERSSGKSLRGYLTYLWWIEQKGAV